MTDNAETQKAKAYFRAAEDSEGKPWIICEAQGPDTIAALSGGFIGFDLERTVTLEMAEDLARILRDQITNVSITMFRP